MPQTNPDRPDIVLIGAGMMSVTLGTFLKALDPAMTLGKCFDDRLTEDGWLPKLREIIPTYGIDLKQDADACRRTRADTASVLHIENV